MTLTSKFVRRAVAAVAATGVAIVIPTVALAASGSANTAANAAAVSRCPRGFLTSWIGIPGSGAAGSTYYQLEISNVSGKTCTLYGFPGVSAIKAGGGRLGSPADRLTGYSELRVTLAPYTTAHVVLQITDVGVFSSSACHPATAVGLRVYAPGDFASMVIPYSFRACGRSGPIYLHVGPTMASTGIPGYTQ
jgi:hypothetical protein